VCVNDLIAGWAPMALIQDTPGVTRLTLLRNLRHALSLSVADLIARWGHCGTNRRRTLLDACLLFDAPMGILAAGCILKLGMIWQPHCQDKQHTRTETYIKPNGAHMSYPGPRRRNQNLYKYAQDLQITHIETT
jgi:hypothetical protein